jgi:hypothetical protein
MLVHSVFFWLKKDLSDEQKALFTEKLQGLTTIKPSVLVTIGTPAATDRPVIDRSYDHALTCIFESMADHDAYQLHPAHKDFIENCAPLWERVLIYDAD